MFEELHSKFEIISKKYTSLKKENFIISSKCETFQKENMVLQNEIEFLKKGKKKKKDIPNSLMLENENLKDKM